MSRLSSGAIALALTLLSGAAAAHRLAPSLLELREVREGVFEISLQRPASVPRGQSEPRVNLPESCRALDDWRPEPVMTATGPALRRVRRVDCGEEGLFGRSIEVAPLDGGNVVMARLTFLGDATITRVLSQRRGSFEVPASLGTWGTMAEYARLGFEHILGGIDHLLFVFGLLLLVSSVRMLVYTITSFTIGHSVTLSLAALGLVRYPSSLVEFLIALSIFWVAVELGRDVERRGLMGRRPALGAGLFGLLHGFGFAGALAESGLPVRELPLALLSFNIGVEAGQLAFVAVILGAGFLFGARLGEGWKRPAIYALGSLAAFWCLERGAAVFAAPIV